jgi:hypothetical protein
MITTGGTITEFTGGLNAGSVPFRIAEGPDGNLWFSDTGPTKAVARLNLGAPAASVSMAIAGGGNLGAPQTCVDRWNDWAGLQPSHTAFGLDGYRWLLDGAAIAGQTTNTYVPTVSDAGHQLSCKVTVTYMLFPTTVSATSATVLIKGADAQLTDLSAAVAGVGPGKSLANKLSDAQAALSAGDVAGTCSILGSFVSEVNAQTGKKISPATAASLIADATRIETVLGC